MFDEYFVHLGSIYNTQQINFIKVHINAYSQLKLLIITFYSFSVFLTAFSLLDLSSIP